MHVCVMYALYSSTVLGIISWFLSSVRTAGMRYFLFHSFAAGAGGGINEKLWGELRILYHRCFQLLP